VRGRHFESQRGRANTGCANRESSGGSTLMPMAWRRRRVQARRGASGSPTASAAAGRLFPPRKSGEERGRRKWIGKSLGWSSKWACTSFAGSAYFVLFFSFDGQNTYSKLVQKNQKWR
jgi:hypothetical protein